MNKKRLYKQNGKLHDRGKKLSFRLNHQIKMIFLENARFSPRDLELMLMHLIQMHANYATYATVSTPNEEVGPDPVPPQDTFGT